jgi:hypothetical protein
MKKPTKIAATVMAYRQPAEPPMSEGIVRVIETIAKRPVYMITHELEPSELMAIGEVTVQWSHLEHVLYVRTLQLAKTANELEPEEAKSLSFATRLKAWKALFRKVVTDPEKLSRLERMHERIASSEDLRHKITHGLWDFNRSDPYALTASSFRMPYQFERKLDFAKLVKLAQRISEINFHLHFPDGPSSLEPSQSHSSRSFLQSITTQERPPMPRLLVAELDKPKKPRRTAKPKDAI